MPAGEKHQSKVRIVDLGRGPQIEGHRLTVMDVFYYLHRGYAFDFIHQAMPSLTRDQFDAVVEYVSQHEEELREKDRQVEEFHKRGMEAQHAAGRDLRRKRGRSYNRRARSPAQGEKAGNIGGTVHLYPT